MDNAEVRGILVAVAVAAGAACGGNEAAVSPADERKPPERRAAHTCAPGAFRALGSPKLAYTAVVRSSAVAYRRPGQGRLARFGRRNVNGVPTVLGVLGEIVGRDCKPRWYRVQLPIRPNGITGYVRAGAVDVATVQTRILVDLSDRRVTLYEGGEEVLEATAAVGSRATPTPVGRFYVNQRLVPDDPNGPYGPGAIGISAFSDVLTGWTQGGPIAIHGTDRPESIGRPTSNGCVRLRNDVLRKVFDAVVAGTPVLIRP